MALLHANPGDVVPLLPADPGPGVPRATAIFKSRDLEVLRLVLAAGDSLPPHRVAGEITVQSVRGTVAVGFAGRDCTLRPGEMTWLAGGVTHDVRAVDDCVALVTIALAH